MTHRVTLFIATLALLLTATASFAATEGVVPSAKNLSQNPAQCAQLAKECFAYTDNERENCFYVAGNHSFCAETELGELILKRWSMAPSQPKPDNTAYSLLGPELVNRECLTNFDNELSSLLIKGENFPIQTSQLSNKLDSCQQPPAVEILRP